jgi:hypothetical protein
MYTTTRNIAGGTFMTCKDCGHAISMNKMCQEPIQSATDMLKHMAAHNASRAFAPVERVTPAEPKTTPSDELAPFLGGPASMGSFEPPIIDSTPLPPECGPGGYLKCLSVPITN